MRTDGPFRSKGLDRHDLTDPAILHAMSRIPRHRFIPDDSRELAYEDRAVGIGRGQTISQPYIVALMTEQANVSRGSKVLEVGLGSGYQAAVLAELGAQVYSVEIIPELAAGAREVLDSLGYGSVQIRVGDGWTGWSEQAPFDAILVAAASPKIPSELIRQLADHGRIVFPLEVEEDPGERLLVIERNGEDLITRDLGPVRFVPLTGSAREVEILTDETATEQALGIGAASDQKAQRLSPVDSGENESEADK